MNLSESNIQYDRMGNISQLTRGSNVPIVYTYLNGGKSNQLASVSGMINSSYLEYDGNGNLEEDLRDDKNIEEDYNILNLPSYTFGDQEGTITYSATGEKLETSDLNAGKTTEYVKGIQYSSTYPYTAYLIDFIQTEEGRAVPDGHSGFKYEYTLKDHLGNTRVCFDNNPSNSGTARAIQETDYYPFGKSQPIYTFGNDSRYLYNGKEQQAAFEEYDYGARFYDPVLARWKSIDPLAEESRRWSPYNYGYNNPIRNIDPDGMEASRFGQEDEDRYSEPLEETDKDGGKGKISDPIGQDDPDCKNCNITAASYGDVNITGKADHKSSGNGNQGEASDAFMNFSLNGTGNLLGLRSVAVSSFLSAGLYKNAAGQIASYENLAKFKMGVPLSKQGNLSKAFISYRSAGNALTWGSRAFSGAAMAWDISQGKPREVIIGDGAMAGMAEVPFIGPPMAAFLWLNSFIPESPSSNFANPGREPGHYAEWLH